MAIVSTDMKEITWLHDKSGETECWPIPLAPCQTGHLLIRGANSTTFWYRYDTDVLAMLNESSCITDAEWRSQVCFKFSKIV